MIRIRDENEDRTEGQKMFMVLVLGWARDKDLPYKGPIPDAASVTMIFKYHERFIAADNKRDELLEELNEADQRITRLITEKNSLKAWIDDNLVPDSPDYEKYLEAEAHILSHANHLKPRIQGWRVVFKRMNEKAE